MLSFRTPSALVVAGFWATLAFGQTHEITSSAPEGNTIHIFRSSDAPVSTTVTTHTTTALNMVNGGGPVMRNPINYVIMWQPPGRAAFPAGYQSGVETFFQKVGGTPFYNIVTQYGDSTGNPVPNAASWGGSYVDTTTAPPSGCNGSIGKAGATPNCPLTDADVQNEVDHAIAANPGWVAAGLNVEYFVLTPSDVDECAGTNANGTDSCFAINGGPGTNGENDFCAYHTYFGGNKIYAYQPFAGNGSCGGSSPYPNGSSLDLAISPLSHEMIESNTDPHINGWKGPGGNDDEIGDKCAYKYGLVVPDGTTTVLNGNRYQIQTEWSNAVTGCAKRYNGPADTLNIPATLNFGIVKAGTSATQSLNITNSGAGAANILYVRRGPATDSAFSLTNIPPTWGTLGSAANLSVNVQFAPFGLPRNATGSVIVDTDETPCDSGVTCYTSSNELVNPLLGAVVIAPAISKFFVPSSVPLGTNSGLSFILSNPNTVALMGVGFTDTLPAGVTVASAAANCNGTPVTAVAGSGVIQLAGATLPPGVCTFIVQVTGTTPGAKVNITTAITSNEAGFGNTATAGLLVVAPPSISKVFLPHKILPGGMGTVSFSITNPNNFVALTGVAFTDSLPAGLAVATPGGLVSTCGGIATASAGTVSLTGGSIAMSGVCTVTANVTAPEGIYLNSVTVTSANGGTGNTSSDTLFVATPPSLSKLFGEVSIGVNNTVSLAFTLFNPNHVVTLSGLQFSDALPAGLMIATPVTVTGTCGVGVITAVAGSGLITLSGAALAPLSNCIFSVNVTANGAASGYLTNTTSVVTSNEALPGATASATIFIGDPFQISYVSNLATADSAIDITNVGTLGSGLYGGTTATVTGAICANVYAFTPDEQLVACCSCPVTPNGLVSFSAKNDLASNTLTPAVPQALVVKVLATIPVAGSCANSAAAVTTEALTNGLKSYGSTVHLTLKAGAVGITEKPFSAGTLSVGELTRIGSLCNFILANGSGYGVCRSCRLGGLGGARQ